MNDDITPNGVNGSSPQGRPWYQRVATSGLLAFVGGAGMVLSFVRLASTASSLTPEFTYLGTAFLILLGIAVHVLLKLLRPRVWFGSSFRITGLGLRPVLAITGGLAVLWMPRVIGNDLLVSAVVELKAQPPAVLVGEKSRIQVFLSGKQIGAGYSCEWEADSLSDFHGRRDCQDSFFQPPGDFVTSDRPLKHVDIKVRVLDSRQKAIGRAVALMVVHYAPKLALTATPGRVFAGEPSILNVSVNGNAPNSRYRCAWEYEGRFPNTIRDEGCRIQYAGLLPGPNVSEALTTIGVRVFDENGSDIGHSEYSLAIVPTPPVYYEFVVDASARTRSVSPWGTPLDLARREISARIDNIEVGGGHVGIQIFGVPGSSPNACDASQSLVPLAPLTVPTLRQSLQRIAPGLPEAPLVLAQRQAVEALARYPNTIGTRHLITITSGGDTCLNEDLVASFRRLRDTISASGIGRLWYEYQFLTITVALAFSNGDVQQWLAVQHSSDLGDAPHVILIAKTPAALSKVLDVSTKLGSKDFSERANACATLASLSYDNRDFAQGGPAGTERIRRFCHVSGYGLNSAERRAVLQPSDLDQIQSPDLDQLELEVRFELFQRGWDIGEDISIVRGVGALILRGTASTSERAREIRSEFGQNSEVRAEIASPEPTTTDPQSAVVINQHTRNRPALLKERLEVAFPSDQTLQSFLHTALSASGEVVSRAVTLHELALRYDATAASHLTPQARSALQNLLRAQIEGLAAVNTNLDSLLQLILTSANAPSIPATDWRSESALLLEASKRQDQAVDMLLVSSADDSSLPIAANQLSQHHSDIRSMASNMLTSVAGRAF